jgi:uncharacterized protein DUF1615
MTTANPAPRLNPCESRRRGLAPFRIVTALALAAIVGACATPGRYESKPAQAPAQRPSPAPVEERGKPAPVEPAWVPPPARPGQREGMLMLTRLFPEGVSDRDAWAADIFDAFAALHVPATPENFCAAIAVIEQESTFHADPVVPGLSRIAWKEIEARRKRYGMPRLLLDAVLARISPNGRSYKARIDTLRTEKQMSELFEDLISEFPYGEHLFARYNPVRTGGPMQVSVQFAEEQVRAAPYPYPHLGSVRHEVFSRRGGLYFGIAHLLSYPASYDEPLYRFADFNAGRYSARNAAFQNALAKITRRRLGLDGDLLRDEGNGAGAQGPSATQRAVYGIVGRLRMSRAEVQRDLELEKSSAFQETLLYQRVFALADRLAPTKLPRAIVPQINLKSPKIKRHLTTEWFARRTNGRYRTCLAREVERVERNAQGFR